MTRSDYWKNRDELEKEANQKYINQDSAYLKELEAHYNLMLDNINKQIDAEYSSLANRNHVSIDLAMQQVSQMDVSIYSTKAKQIVEEAAKIKNKVSYSDYPDAVNQELRVYNATMRINRLELLKANVGLEIQKVGLEIYNEASNRLAQRYKAESKRQAGILGLNEPADRLYASPDMRNVINATVKGATWSQRLWANQQGLRYAVNQLLTTGATNSNRQKLKELLQTTVNNWRYVTQRLINTELARVQYKAQKDSITKADYKYVKWIAEPKACSTCNRIARTDNGWGKGVWELEKVPDIPQDTHPNCRCAISAHWVDDISEKEKAYAGYRVGNSKVDLDYIKSDEFKHKFKQASDNPKLNKQLYKLAKAMLTHRNGTDGEDSYILNKNGEILASSFGKDDDLSVGFSSKKIHNLLKSNSTLIGIHNHPTNVGPSGADYAVANNRNYKFAFVITHDGRVFKYHLYGTHVLAQRLDIKLEKTRKLRYDLDENQVYKLVLDQLKGAGFSCEELK